MKRINVAAKKRKGEKVCTGKDLAAVVAKAPLSEEEARAWRRDLKAARKKLMPREERRDRGNDR